MRDAVNCGNGIYFTPWNFNVCGHSSFSAFNHCLDSKTPKEWEKWIDKQISTKGTGYSVHNVSFALSASQLNFEKCGPTVPIRLEHYLINYTTCRAIHVYKNNAHDPYRYVIMFMWHTDEKANDLDTKNWGVAPKDWIKLYKTKVKV